MRKPKPKRDTNRSRQRQQPSERRINIVVSAAFQAACEREQRPMAVQARMVLELWAMGGALYRTVAIHGANAVSTSSTDRATQTTAPADSAADSHDR